MGEGWVEASLPDARDKLDKEVYAVVEKLVKKQGLDRSRSGGHPEMSGEFPQDRGSGLWDLLVGASLPSTRPTR